MCSDFIDSTCLCRSTNTPCDWQCNSNRIFHNPFFAPERLYFVSKAVVQRFLDHFLCFAGALLNPAYQFVALTVGIAKVIVCQAGIFLFQLAFGNIPVSFDLLFIHNVVSLIVYLFCLVTVIHLQDLCPFWIGQNIRKTGLNGRFRANRWGLLNGGERSFCDMQFPEAVELQAALVRREPVARRADYNLLVTESQPALRSAFTS